MDVSRTLREVIEVKIYGSRPAEMSEYRDRAQCTQMSEDRDRAQCTQIGRSVHR
jgi:hypothetical protein